MTKDKKDNKSQKNSKDVKSKDSNETKDNKQQKEKLDKNNNKPEKESKSDKETKPKQDKNDDKKKTDNKNNKSVKADSEKRNKETIEAGLTFNVKDFRRWMKTQFDVKDEENMPKFNGGHIALTASVEQMLKHIVDAAKSNLPKGSSGLYELSKGVITYVLQIDEDLKRVFRYHLEKYDDEENYSSNYTVDKATMAQYIDTHYSKNVVLTTEGHNMLAYLLKKFAISITKYSKELLAHSGKKSLNGKTVMSAVRLLCPETLSNSINMKVESACKLAGEEDKDDDKDDNKEDKKEKDKKDDDEEDDEDDDKDDDNEEEDDKSEDENMSEPEEEQSDDEDKKQKTKPKKQDSKNKKNSK